MLHSVWKKPAVLPSFPRLEHDIRTDILIIGGGLAGILCAFELSQAGIDHTLIEADRICGGVTGNTTAKITSQHGPIYHKLIRESGVDAARLYWEANEGALQRFRTLAQGIDCDFETRDSYLYATASPALLEKELAALEKIGAPADFVDALPLPFPVAGAIRTPNQAQFHPLKFVSGILEGLRIYEHTPARAFEGSTVITDHGRITASRIILATHFPILNKHGAYFLKMYQARSYVLALKGAPALEGMYRDAAKDGLSFRSYGDLLLLGGGGHRTGKSGGGFPVLETFARQHYPTATETGRWATQDCMTLDGIPYIGQYSKATPRLFTATGFNKWGMTSSMAAAMLLRDLVQGKSDPHAALFHPSRSILRPQLLYNIGESVRNLLTPTTPRCPHLGCALKWNPQEHSWDCPCHGSRFAEDGKRLDNPATGDLKTPDSQ